MMEYSDKVADDLFLFVRKESFVDDEPICLDTRLEDDLGIYGDDAVEFILKYAKKYNVDVKRFMAADYFSSEGRSVLPSLLHEIFGTRENSRKALTVRHLYNGIKYGRLDDEIIHQTD
ncbi:DUF1493 family protein [Parapedobacter sp. GCM10030251]|uniref:DUF1493 family protein n=1 Tax=Parapedobacter sp. GCM10030251 TaxID=3273419 RepID=UPI00361681B0